MLENEFCWGKFNALIPSSLPVDFSTVLLASSFKKRKLTIKVKKTYRTMNVVPKNNFIIFLFVYEHILDGVCTRQTEFSTISVV